MQYLEGLSVLKAQRLQGVADDDAQICPLFKGSAHGLCMIPAANLSS